jgi:PqqD family protein of HPr-rel-A system
MIRIKENIAVSGSGFLFDPNTGESYSLNKTGREILSLLAEKPSRSDLENHLLERYDVEPGQLSRYLDDFFHMLKRFELTEDESHEG